MTLVSDGVPLFRYVSESVETLSDETIFLVASSETMENRQLKTRPTRKSKTYLVTSVCFLQL